MTRGDLFFLGTCFFERLRTVSLTEERLSRMFSFDEEETRLQESMKTILLNGEDMFPRKEE